MCGWEKAKFHIYSCLHLHFSILFFFFNTSWHLCREPSNFGLFFFFFFCFDHADMIKYLLLPFVLMFDCLRCFSASLAAKTVQPLYSPDKISVTSLINWLNFYRYKNVWIPPSVFSSSNVFSFSTGPTLKWRPSSTYSSRYATVSLNLKPILHFGC